MRTGDYKLSPGLNAATSVAKARETKTLDGKRWWPSQTIHLEHATGFKFELNCRHVRKSVAGADVLEKVAGVTPGHPGPPTLL
jgi:hypothetical protein